jgi:NADH-ubiquinone oxidoreductase chain 1
LFLGGYLLMNNLDIFNLIHFIFSNLFFVDWILDWRSYTEYFLNNSIIEGLLYGLNIGLKSSILIFVFIWTRASFPRIRFDQLMAFCWTVLLPILFALIILVPCILFSYNIFSININLF